MYSLGITSLKMCHAPFDTENGEEKIKNKKINTFLNLIIAT